MNINPTIIFWVLMGGVLPAIFWLWFWLREDQKKPEPRSLITLAFFVGAISIAVVIPLQQIAALILPEGWWRIFAWAGIEEFVKLMAAFIATFHKKALDEPVDYMIYLITVALGFSAFENALFLIKSFSEAGVVASALTLSMRFLGATLLHVLASSVMGGVYALAFCRGNFSKITYMIAGLLLATLLHTLFNFFIISGGNILLIFSCLWLGIVILLLFFEKVKRIVCEMPLKNRYK